MRHPPVSIIINNYNYAAYLPEAIESALAQTYAPAEVIVVDDGSTDASRQVIAGYGGRIVPVLKENGGMASAHNAGFAAARGEVILLLDADDALLPTAVERAIPLLEPSDTVKVHWRLIEIAADGTRTGNVVPGDDLPSGDLREAMLEEGPWAGTSAPTSGNAWKRDFLEQVMPIPERQFRRAADAYLFTLAPLFGRVATLNEPQSLYRVHDRNDYAGRSADEKLQLLLHTYEHQCRAMARHLSDRGATVDADRWTAGNPHYEWMNRVNQAFEDLSWSIPPGSRFILIDDCQWQIGDSTQLLPGRWNTPLMERNGEYWGSPPDDAAAIEALECQRRAGNRYLVVAWPAFWWLEHYPAFTVHLEARYPRLHHDERFVAFDLGEETSP